MARFFPSLLVALAPAFDVVRLLTRDPTWGYTALWAALLGVLVVALAVSRELVDWRATDRHTRARRAGVAPLTMHLAALAPLALGVFDRLQLAAATRAAAAAALPSLTRLDAWPMALALAGALAWLVGSAMSEARLAERVRYQPTDARTSRPTRATSRPACPSAPDRATHRVA
ncbi:MAG TPA: hypothetical protein VHB97_01330 [Polyangia bacterium]|nr:hypothetical protein [Polyangia bacterium]